jgi:hypothetical protein
MIQVNDGAPANGHVCFMSASFDAIILSGGLIPLALPLVRATWPVVDMAAWQTYVQFFNDRAPGAESGVLGLRDEARCLCGVLAFRLDRDVVEGPVLAVPLFTAADVANSPRTIRALLDAAETRALDLGCMAVRIHLANGQAGLASRLRLQGLSPDIGQYWSKVDPARQRN